MLANSKKQDLFEHLFATANLAKCMAINMGLENKLQAQAYTSGLLHDIAKVINDFQSYIIKKQYNEIEKDDYEDFISLNKPFHHEIGWAFLTLKIKEKNILSSIFWHHALPFSKDRNNNTSSKILSEVEKNCKEDLDKLETIWEKLKEFIPENIDKSNFNNYYSSDCSCIDIPHLFEKDDGSSNRNDNAELMTIRTCLISSDRYISSLNNNQIKEISEDSEDLIKCKKIIEEMKTGSIIGEFQLPSNYDPERFEFQKNIIKDIGESQTTIVKAPAGFGKTLMGVLWTKQLNKKVFWVCPRNSVADAVYENILKELQNFNLKCSVELYRSGKRQKANSEGETKKDFDCDIIVTNIDTLMAPMINNSISHRLFSVYGFDVILDEFHELISSAPLFSIFITYMRARHRLSNCRTLLLSATPSLVYYRWDTSDKRTLILPNETQHYRPQHNLNYEIQFKENFPASSTNGSLLVCNSVTQSQENFGRNYTYLIHSQFTETDRKRNEKQILGAFSKKGNGLKNGESVSAALVVQSAMDISFFELNDSVFSPEATCQRVGRVNRWGDEKNNYKINFLNLIKNKNEEGSIRNLYNIELQKKWYSFLKENLENSTSKNLEKIYEIYNLFNEKFKGEIINYIKEQYQRSLEDLIDYKPIKVLEIKKKKNKSKSARSLRNPDGSYFYTVEKRNHVNEWIEPEEVLSRGKEIFDKFERDEDYRMELNNSSRMQFRIKNVINSGYSFWEKHLTKITGNIRFWKKQARNPETPFPDFSKVYDEVLGVVKK